MGNRVDDVVVAFSLVTPAKAGIQFLALPFKGRVGWDGVD
jgi:hypothetical protein